MSDKTSVQKCGKWCGCCGKPATYLIVSIGCQAEFCDDCAKLDPSFGKKDEEFGWYEIPKEQQETERATSLRGYNKTLEELAQNIHRMRPDAVAEFYRAAVVELQKQYKECNPNDYELLNLFRQAMCHAEEQRLLFAVIRTFQKEK